MPHTRILFAALLGLPLTLQAAGTAYDALALDNAESGRSGAAASNSPTTRLALLSEDEVRQRLASPAGQEELLALARSALKERPLNAQAFWVLGHLAREGSAQSPKGELQPAQADQLFSAGSALSRRHGGIALGELRNAAQRGNLEPRPVALDRLLLVHPEHRAQLDLLAGQLGDADLREALAPYARRPWFAALLRSAASEKGNPGGAAVLLADSGLGVNELAPGLLTALFDRLVAIGDVAGAQALAAKMGTGLSPEPTNFGLGGPGGDQRFAPLAWRISAPATIVGSGKQATVSAELMPGISAVLLERVTTYLPGAYRLSVTVSSDSLAERPPLRWELECLEGGTWQKRWDQSIPAGFDLQRYAMTPNWTAACTAQRWRLKASPAEGQLGASLRISQLALEPSTQS